MTAQFAAMALSLSSQGTGMSLAVLLLGAACALLIAGMVKRVSPSVCLSEPFCYELVRWTCVAGMAMVVFNTAATAHDSPTCTEGESHSAETYPIVTGTVVIGPPLCIDGIRYINVLERDGGHGN